MEPHGIAQKRRSTQDRESIVRMIPAPMLRLVACPSIRCGSCKLKNLQGAPHAPHEPRPRTAFVARPRSPDLCRFLPKPYLQGRGASRYLTYMSRVWRSWHPFYLDHEAETRRVRPGDLTCFNVGAFLSRIGIAQDLPTVCGTATLLAAYGALNPVQAVLPESVWQLMRHVMLTGPCRHLVREFQDWTN